MSRLLLVISFALLALPGVAHGAPYKPNRLVYIFSRSKELLVCLQGKPRALSVKRNRAVLSRVSGSCQSRNARTLATVASDTVRPALYLNRLAFLLQGAGATAAPSKAKGASAAALFGDFEKTLASLAPCATFSAGSGGVTATFPSSCTIAGTSVSGKVAAGLSEEDNLKLTFTPFSVAKAVFSGTVEVSVAEERTSYLTNLKVNAESKTFDLNYQGTIARDQTGYLFTGAGALGETSSNLQVATSAANLHKARDGSCYPNGGSITLDYGRFPSVKITFRSATPVTREVQLQVGTLPATTETLSACPLEASKR